MKMPRFQFAGGWGALVLAMAGAGCDRLAFDPVRGRLEAVWTVNQQAACEVPQGVPVLVKVEVRNRYRFRVRVPAGAVPGVEGAPEVSWKVLRSLPASLGPGAVAEAWWLLQGQPSAGSYEIGFPDAVPITGAAGELVIRDGPVPAPMLLEQRAMVAKLSGTALELAEELRRQPEAAILPTTRLVIADLLREAGKREEASQQLESLAERVYGAEALPGWLQSKMRAVAPTEPRQP
jgi:hypothetical protein